MLDKIYLSFFKTSFPKLLQITAPMSKSSSSIIMVDIQGYLVIMYNLQNEVVHMNNSTTYFAKSRNILYVIWIKFCDIIAQ